MPGGIRKPCVASTSRRPHATATRRRGGLAAGSDLYLDPIRHWFGELLYQPHLRPIPRIEFAHLGPLAGAVGAALLPELAS